MAWAEREVELANVLDHDRGLAVVQDAGLETAHVRWANKHELAGWRAARREERLLRQERRSFEGYRRREGSFERYVDASLAPRLVTALDLDKQRGFEPAWATLHAISARYGCELGIAENGRIGARDVGIGAMRLIHEQQVRNRRSALAAEGRDPADVAAQISNLRAQYTLEETHERERKQSAAFTQLPALLQALPMLRLYEADIVEPLRALQAKRTRQAREAYHERKRDTEASAVSMEERLDARREALREMRSAVAAAYRELRPEPFGKWLQDREERYENSRPLIRQQERGQSRQQSFLRAEELARSDHLDLGR